jgi:hypothetical protein
MHRMPILSQLDTNVPSISFGDGTPTPTIGSLVDSTGGLLNDSSAADAIAREMGLPNDQGDAASYVQLALAGNSATPPPLNYAGPATTPAEGFGSILDVVENLLGIVSDDQALARQQVIQKQFDDRVQQLGGMFMMTPTKIVGSDTSGNWVTYNGYVDGTGDVWVLDSSNQVWQHMYTINNVTYIDSGAGGVPADEHFHSPVPPPPPNKTYDGSGG